MTRAKTPLFRTLGFLAGALALPMAAQAGEDGAGVAARRPAAT